MKLIDVVNNLPEKKSTDQSNFTHIFRIVSYTDKVKRIKCPDSMFNLFDLNQKQNLK